MIVLSVLRGLERLFFGGFQKIAAEQGKVGIGVFGGRRKPLFFKDFLKKWVLIENGLSTKQNVLSFRVDNL